MRLLELSKVCFSYGRKTVLSDISLQLKRGSVMFLFGPNGCGKSTLLGCVTGFNRPESGSVLISGKPLREYNSRQLAALVSYIPQSHTKTFPYKVSEVVLMGRTFSYGMFSSPGQKDRSLAAEALEKAGLIGFENRPYTELSGGELRLVLIARALCQNSPLMLLDEPTSHLDFKHEINVMNTLAKLVKETGLTLLLASHSLNHPFFFESEGINTSVALMDKGRILQTGRPESVCTRENIYGVYGIEARLKVHHEDGKNRYYVISWKQE